MRYQGVDLEVEDLWRPPPKSCCVIGPESGKGPRYYFLNRDAYVWSSRTGRPVWEWLWEQAEPIE